MTPTDRPAFLEIIVGFCELKGRQLSAPALELYWRALADWSMVDFRQAAEHLLRTCEFMPTPADFETLRRAGKPTAGEAWARAVQHAASGGYRRALLGDDAIDLLVRGLGGYQAIARCEESKLHFLERRFTEHFDALADRVDTRRALPQITSIERPTNSVTSSGLVKIGRPK